MLGMGERTNATWASARWNGHYLEERMRRWHEEATRRRTPVADPFVIDTERLT